MGFQQRRFTPPPVVPVAVAVTRRNYYCGGMMNKQRLTRGFGWAVLIFALLSLGH